MAFYAHTGISSSAYLARAASTFNTFLTDIYNDVNDAVASGTNRGWTVYDYNPTPTLPVSIGYVAFGGLITETLGFGLIFTSNSTGVTTSQAVDRKLGRNFAADTSSFTIDLSPNNGTNWVSIASVTSVSTSLLATPWPVANTSSIYTLSRVSATGSGIQAGYVVLKCSSSNAMTNFFVKVQREPSFGNLARVTAYAGWNNTTHSGTSPSFDVMLRAQDLQGTATTSIKYFMWLLPDTFALNPQGANYSDISYTANLIPMNAGDTTALVHLGTNQEITGHGPGYVSFVNTPLLGGAYGLHIGFEVYKDIANLNTWSPASINIAVGCNVFPRAPNYCQDQSRSLLDIYGKLQATEFDVYSSVGASAASNTTQKRGEMRYVKSPIGWPVGAQGVTFGPGEDGNTYIMIRCDLHGQTAIASSLATPSDVQSGATAYIHTSSGFASYTGKGAVAASDFIATADMIAFSNRYLLLPINL